MRVLEMKTIRFIQLVLIAFLFLFRVKIYASDSESPDEPESISVVVSVTEVSVDSVRIEWEPVNEADGYNVYREHNGDIDTYEVSKETVSFTDMDVVPEEEYGYYIECYQIIQEEKQLLCQSETVWAKTDLGQTDTLSASMTGPNVTIRWESYPGAEGYRVFRRELGYSGLWDILVTTSSGESLTSYVDDTESIGKVYQYTVRAYITRNGKQYWTGFNTDITCDTSDIGSVKTLSANLKGANVTVNWDIYFGAEGYRVFRREVGDSGLWDILTTTSTGEAITSFTDTTEAIGKNYQYTVRAYVTRNGVRYWTDFNTDVTCDTASIESLRTTSATLNGANVIVQWESFPGAEGYRVFRREVGYSGLWDILTTTTSGESLTNYTDNSEFIGKNYQYTVRAYVTRNGERYWTDFNTDVTCNTQNIASLKTLSATLDGADVTVKWEAYPGAAGYRVFRREVGDSGLWDILTTTSTGEVVTTFVDNTELIGKNYQYTVRAYITRNGERYWTDFNTNITCDTSSIESVKTLSAVMKGANVIIKWRAFPGATGYRVYRRELGNTGLWDVLTTTSSGESVTSYTDNTELIGKKYQYTVRAYFSRNGERYWSEFNTDISCDTSDIGSVKTLSAVMKDANVAVKWEVYPGATGYRVYRRELGNTGLWDILTTTSSGEAVSSYTDNTELIGKKYQYTVRAYFSRNGEKYWSDFNTNIVCDTSNIGPAKTLSAKMSGANVLVKWEAYSGAEGYRVFRREVGNSGLWDILSSSTGKNTTSFIDKTAVRGKTYNYTVRAKVVRGGETLWSGFNTNVSCKVTEPTSVITIDQYLGVTRSDLVRWLSSHEHDSYYLGTPMAYENSSNIYGWNPTGNCRPLGRYRGNNPGMNCTGFVADVFLYSGVTTARMNELVNEGHRVGGWRYGSYINGSTWYCFATKTGYIKYYHFNTVEEMLASGKLKKGDVIFFQPYDSVWNAGRDRYGNKADCHIGFFWGNTSSDNKFWHQGWVAANGFWVPGTTRAITNQITNIAKPCESSIYVFPLSD